MSQGFYLSKWSVDAQKTTNNTSNTATVFRAPAVGTPILPQFTPPPCPPLYLLVPNIIEDSNHEVVAAVALALQAFLYCCHLSAEMLLIASPIPTKVTLCSMKPMLQAVIILWNPVHYISSKKFPAQQPRQPTIMMNHDKSLFNEGYDSDCNLPYFDKAFDVLVIILTTMMKMPFLQQPLP